jgi:excisionase family DNA binding protein
VIRARAGLTIEEKEMSETSSELLNISQAAEMLKLSKGTIRNLITRGDLKADRIGRSIRIRKENINALLTPYSGGEFGVWK